MAAVAAMLSICMSASLFAACGEASFVRLDKATATMYVGDTLTLTATTDKADAEIVWSSDATHIATVDGGGTVTALAAGEVTIKAKSGSVKATCDITVVEKQEEKPEPKPEPEPDPESPVWHPADAATCTAAGNIEYWTKGGKYYADEECTREISADDTTVKALGHDFEGGEYDFDAASHWKKCARSDCYATGTKAAHSYTDGKCVCGKEEPKPEPEPEPEKPVMHPANAATCTAAGNIEYWTKGGKYFADEECTHEITEADTVTQKLGHDFDGGAYESDENSHWKICSRTGCGITSAKTAHSYSGGECVCGRKEPAPAAVPLEKKTNSEVRANPGKWFYHIDGGEGSDYVFSAAPEERADKSLYVAFSVYNISKGNNKYFYFRYQPGYALGTQYTLTFKAMMNVGGEIRYGAPAKKASGGGDYTTFKTASLAANSASKFTFDGTVNDVEPFSVRIDTADSDKNVTLTLSDISIVSKSPAAEHHAANAATCTLDGNTEYWTKGGKYYSDEECTHEITAADTVTQKLGHDFESGAYLKDDDVHWKVCARSGCAVLSAKTAHSYSSGVCVCGKEEPKPATATIKEKYADYFRIGAAVQAGKLSSGYGDLMKHFGSVTPENSMKWKNLEGTKGTYTFNKSGDSADKLIQWAKANGVGVRGHCLLWYKSLPSWLHDEFDGKAYSGALKTSALGYIDKNIENVMKHFGNDVYVWDVVNEALFNEVTASKLSDTSKGKYGNIWRTNDNMPASGDDWVDWYKVCGGYEYIAHAFKKADEVRKTNNLSVELYYNDYGLNNPSKRQACLNLVEMLSDSGAPIDGIGMQAHYKLDSYTSDKATWLKNFEDSVKAFIDAGLDVQITELDIRFEGELTDELEAEQGEMYGKIFEICRKNAKTAGKAHGVTGVTTWGVQDGCNSAWSDGQYPLIFGTDKQPKKAFDEIMKF